MKNLTIYRSITKEDLEEHDTIHDAVNYIDDATNIVGADNLADIQEYLIKFNLQN